MPIVRGRAQIIVAMHIRRVRSIGGADHPNEPTPPNAQSQYDPLNSSSHSGPHNAAAEPPMNSRAANEDVQEYLRRVRPSNDLPVHPDEPYPVVSDTDLRLNHIVWYRHVDGTWHLTRVLSFVPSHDVPTAFRVMAEGQKVWLGQTYGLDPRDPYRTREVLLVPGAGNAKPYTWYTCLLLRCWNLIPRDDRELENMLNRFAQTIGRN